MTTPSGQAAALLAALPMFRRTARGQIAELARRTVSRHVRAGSVIIRRGERVPGLMTVRYGLVKISVHGDSERVIRLVGPGETFGEAALFLEQPLPVDVAALADTALVIVPGEPLLALFDSDPRFARGLLAAVCQRLQAMVADFEAATVHGARARLAAYLRSLAGPAPATARLPAAKSVIAARLGMAKETFSRVLRAFRDEGLVEVAGRDVRILDGARLDAAARLGFRLRPADPDAQA
ncbi:MAG TPA: Crp/Fnr family transcriptional regulator [Burkholderiales bacterium]|jgi:CRP-like cAMP-binding protein